MTGVTFAYLAEANTFEMIGTIGGLLKQLCREIPECEGLKEEYVEKVMAAGSHGEAVEISYEYAERYLATTLRTSEYEPSEPTVGSSAAERGAIAREEEA